MAKPLVRRLAIWTGVTALVGMGMLTACAAKEKPAENVPSSKPSTTASISPTEKSAPGAMTPGQRPSAGNSLAPTAGAHQPPTVLPGG